MQFFALLADVIDVSLLEQGYEIGLNWLGRFARVIIEGVGIVGLGIIVFNLVLKAITLPFDIYQRVNSRKQNLIMEQMKPELEKLQKQYANDKTMYNQKMLELQKKNGYSMLGACLPMIVSLVILIVAWQGFRAYSQYANLRYFVNMSESYNAAILEHGVDGEDYALQTEEDGTYSLVGEDGTLIPIGAWEDGTVIELGGDVIYTMTDIVQDGKTNKYLTVKSADESKYIYYYYNLETAKVKRDHLLDWQRLYNELAKFSSNDDEVREQAISAIRDHEDGKLSFAEMREKSLAYVVRIGATAAAERFRSDDPGFLWIKNVWYPDVSYSHPVPDYSAFKSGLSNVKVTFPDQLDSNGKAVQEQLTSVVTEVQYNNLTSQLTEEKSAANGYFILIVLSIGFMLLSQIIVMKSSKATNQYQTVDGQGAKSQKMMLIIMPIIYAFFSFQYSAAFSIYMTMSSIVAIIVTLLSNLIIGKVFKKREEKLRTAEYTRKLPWMEDKKSEKSKKNGK